MPEIIQGKTVIHRFSNLSDPKPTMLRSTQYSFHYLHLKFAVRFHTAKNIQDALSTTFALFRVSNLAGQNFRTSAFFIAKLVFMAGLGHLPEVSISVHSPAVDYIKITATGLIQLNLCRVQT